VYINCGDHLSITPSILSPSLPPYSHHHSLHTLTINPSILSPSIPPYSHHHSLHTLTRHSPLPPASVFTHESNQERLRGKKHQCLTLAGVEGGGEPVLHILLPTPKVCRVVALKLRMLVTCVKRLGGADEEAQRICSKQYTVTGELPATKMLCGVLALGRRGKEHMETDRRFSTEGVRKAGTNHALLP
jgi:hypothetical protein